MYAEYYNLTGLPFQLTPDSRFFFESSVHSKAMAHLTYGLNQAEGFIVITGDVGAGKTTLVEHLCSTLDPQQYVIARMLSTQTSADDTLRLVANGFGIQSEGISKAELLRRFEDTLVANYNDGRRSLLVIDEAQNLTVPAIEELRMLSNFVVNHSPPLQSFLLGQPQFRGIMALPELEQLRQRVLASFHLGPLTETDTRSYIEHRLSLVAGRPTRVSPMVRSGRSTGKPAACRARSTRCARALCCSASLRRPTSSTRRPSFRSQTNSGPNWATSPPARPRARPASHPPRKAAANSTSV
jgi:general secretion pathway protein A